MWKPISIDELRIKITKGEQDLISNLYERELFFFWKNIEINPEKWEDEDGYSEEGKGFYIVAISGRRVIWYNDIEEGFNISFYNEYGIIRDHICEQHDLNHAVLQLYTAVKNSEKK